MTEFLLDMAASILKNISGYKFIALNNLSELKASFLKICTDLSLKGTILLSLEGINLSLCGSADHMSNFLNHLKLDQRFSDIYLQTSIVDQVIFQRLKVKIKKEIITFKQTRITPTTERAKTISPTELKLWLDEARNFILLDTRNQYEVEYGTFMKAQDLKLKHFVDFPSATNNLEKNATIVMFCTGGIRCEKAALYLQQQGHTDVYQLEGGILNYFKQVGRAHYRGDCFVFDEREMV